MSLVTFAKVEPNGLVILQAKTATPEVDGYDLTTADGYPYHAHPEATPDTWALIEGGAEWHDKRAFVPPSAEKLLADAVQARLRYLSDAYNSAMETPLVYMGSKFQTGPDSRARVSAEINICGGHLPDNFYWVDMNNRQVAMTFEQFKGLGSAMHAQGWVAFSNLQAKKQIVKTAKSIEAVNEVTW